MSISKNRILHYISKTGTFMLLYGLIYIIQDLIFGRVELINHDLWGIPIKFLLFSTISIFLITKYIKIGSPYK